MMVASASVRPETYARPAISRLVYRAVLLLALLLPFEVVTRLVRVGSLSQFTNLEITAALVGLAWVLTLLAERRLPRIDRHLALPGLAFLLVCGLSALMAPGARLDALRFTARMAAGFVIFVLVADVIDSRERATALMKVLAASGVIVAGLGLLEYLEVPPVLAFLSLFKAHPTQVGGFLRVSSSLMYATITSMYLELTLPLLVAWLMSSLGKSRRLGERVEVMYPRAAPLTLYLGVVLVLEAIILTFTRAGLIAVAAGLAMMALRWSRRHGVDGAVRGMGVASASFGVLLILAALTAPALGLRLVSESDASWYRARYQMLQVPTLTAGEVTTVEVELTNAGQRSWPAAGQHAFTLSYHWLTADGKETIVFEGLRTQLPYEIQPGDTVRLQARLRAPSKSGTYRLAWDMVQERTTWFSAKGSLASAIPVQVLPGMATTSQPEGEPFAFEPVELPPNRLTLWRVAAKMFLDRPVLGVGPDNFRQLYGQYTGEQIWNRAIHANNLYFEILADLGIVGGGVFFWLMISLGRALHAAFHQARRDPFEPWVLGLIGSLTAFLVHGLLDYFLEFTSIYLVFWMILALVTVSTQIAGGAHADRL